MRHVRSAVLAAAFTALAWPLHAADGVMVVEQTTISGQVRVTRVQIEPQRMRAEVTDQAGVAQVVIFDGDRQVLWIVREAQRSYMELTRADVEALGSQMNSMMAMLEQRLKNMPPAQRAQMEAMMKGRGGMPGMPAMGSQAPIEYRRAGSATVGAWSCQIYEGFQGGQKTSEVCTVEPAALGFTDADFAVSGQLAEFLRALMPQAADQIFSVGSSGGVGYSGVPVRRTTLGGQPAVSEVTGLTRETFQDSLFTVPDGFTQQAMPTMPGMPPGR